MRIAPSVMWLVLVLTGCGVVERATERVIEDVVTAVGGTVTDAVQGGVTEPTGDGNDTGGGSGGGPWWHSRRSAVTASTTIWMA